MTSKTRYAAQSASASAGLVTCAPVPPTLTLPGPPPLPRPLPQAEEYHEKLVAACVELDDAALEAYFEGVMPDEDTLRKLIRKGTIGQCVTLSWERAGSWQAMCRAGYCNAMPTKPGAASRTSQMCDLCTLTKPPPAAPLHPCQELCARVLWDCFQKQGRTAAAGRCRELPALAARHPRCGRRGC